MIWAMIYFSKECCLLLFVLFFVVVLFWLSLAFLALGIELRALHVSMSSATELRLQPQKKDFLQEFNFKRGFQK